MGRLKDFQLPFDNYFLSYKCFIKSDDSSFILFMENVAPWFLYKIEEVFYHKRKPMPWGHLFTRAYELSEHTSIILGYYDYYPYLLKLNGVLVTVKEQGKEEQEPIFAQQIVEDYIYLDELLFEKVSIYSFEGIKVFEGYTQGLINVKHLPSSVYFLKIGTKI